MSRAHGFLAAAFFTLLGISVPAVATPPASPVLLTLEWPPYTGIKLPGEGWSSQRVRQVYGALGKQVRIGFFSWRRTFSLPYSDKRFAGYFPEYPSGNRIQMCHFSAPIGSSVVGIIERRDKPLHWQTVDDLLHYRMGVVEEYVNEEHFDEQMAQGKAHVVKSADDAHSLLRLLNGEVDGAIMDTQVFNWMMRNTPELAPARGKLQVNPQTLKTWPLTVCFRKDADGAAMRDEFNAGLARLPIPTAPAAPSRPAVNGAHLPAG